MGPTATQHGAAASRTTAPQIEGPDRRRESPRAPGVPGGQGREGRPIAHGKPAQVAGTGAAPQGRVGVPLQNWESKRYEPEQRACTQYTLKQCEGAHRTQRTRALGWIVHAAPACRERSTHSRREPGVPSRPVLPLSGTQRRGVTKDRPIAGVRVGLERTAASGQGGPATLGERGPPGVGPTRKRSGVGHMAVVPIVSRVAPNGAMDAATAWPVGGTVGRTGTAAVAWLSVVATTTPRGRG